MGISRQTVHKALANAEPPRHRLSEARPCPVMAPYHDVIVHWLKEDEQAPSKQRHTPWRIYHRLRAGLGPAGPLLFQFCAHRYEQGSLIVTNNLGFLRWVEVFGDATLRIPTQTDHLFRFKSTTDSELRIPTQTDHPFRFKSTTHSVETDHRFRSKSTTDSDSFRPLLVDWLELVVGFSEFPGA